MLSWLKARTVVPNYLPPGSRARGSFRSVDFSALCVQTAVAAHYTNTRMSAYRLTKCHTGLPNGMPIGLGTAAYVNLRVVTRCCDSAYREVPSFNVAQHSA